MSGVVRRLERGVLWVELARPERRNAMDRAMVGGLLDCIAAAEDPAVRMLVIRGRGGHFCSGGDVADMLAAAAEPAHGEDPIALMNRSFGRLLSAVAEAPKPVIAVCEGAVMGGGFGLAAVADVTLAVDGARFQLPELSLGVTPAQILPFLLRRVGPAAVAMAVTGLEKDAAWAERVGLATDRCSADGVDDAVERLVAGVRAAHPDALRAARQLARRAAGADLDRLLDDAAREFAVLARGPGAAEGMTARLARRRPSWAE